MKKPEQAHSLDYGVSERLDKPCHSVEALDILTHIPSSANLIRSIQSGTSHWGLPVRHRTD